jgi:hypothetical protein
MRPERLEYILDSGWCLLIIYFGPRTKINWPGINKHIISIIQRARRDPTLRGKYGMIGGNAKPTASNCIHLDGRPVIPGFETAKPRATYVRSRKKTVPAV